MKTKTKFSKADIANLIHLVARHADMLVMSADTDEIHKEVILKAMSVMEMQVRTEDDVMWVSTGIDPKSYKVGR